MVDINNLCMEIYSPVEPCFQATSPSFYAKPRQEGCTKYKMMICKNWEQGYCRFGDECLFAHGEREVKAVNPYYKTRQCKAFHRTGFCKFGPKCQFRHSEKRRLPIFEEIEKRGERLTITFSA